MKRQIIKEILLDQRELYLDIPYNHRDYALETNVNYCFVGIRRTGKSYLLYQLAHLFIDSGIPEQQIIFVNFEDERLLELRTEDFNTILEIAYELAGTENKPYFFLDEIQNVKGWENFVRRLADMKFCVNITGSNSKMLSREIASTLGGRFMMVPVYPYSFPEFLMANGTKNNPGNITTKTRAKINSLFSTYLHDGAFPELVNIANRKDYLNSIYQTIYLGDIIAKHNISNNFAMRLIMKKIAESIMKSLSFGRLTNILKSAGLSLGKQTVINYVGYAREAFLIFSITNFASKLVDKETSPKYYFMDNGLISLLSVGNIDSVLLENLAAIELSRRYGTDNVFYFEKNIEVDFVIPEHNLAFQVCLNLSDSETYERETKAFISLKKFLPDMKCIILTLDEERNIDINGMQIRAIPMWKWMMDHKD